MNDTERFWMVAIHALLILALGALIGYAADSWAIGLASLLLAVAGASLGHHLTTEKETKHGEN